MDPFIEISLTTMSTKKSSTKTCLGEKYSAHHHIESFSKIDNKHNHSWSVILEVVGLHWSVVNVVQKALKACPNISAGKGLHVQRK